MARQIGDLPNAPGGGSKPNPKEWTLAYDSFEPKQERLREVLTSTGNGHFCTRGSAEWADVDDVHYPGTYAHGCYNRETTLMGGRPVRNEDLVNLPKKDLYLTKSAAVHYTCSTVLF